MIFSIAISAQSAYAGMGGFGSGPSAPMHTTIMPSHGSFGFGDAPIVYWGEPFMLELNAGPAPDGMNLCNGVNDITSITVGLGPFSDNVFGFEGEFLGAAIFFMQPAYAGPMPDASQPMTEIDSVNGIWKANFPALLPLHGNAVITYFYTCESTGTTINSMEDGGIFMDPSGQVTNDCTDQPIENAQVTLLSNHFGFPLNFPPSNTFIPPVNPLSTDINGLYAWDVQEDFSYQVSVEATLATGADQDYVPQMSEVLPVPPPRTGIDFALVPVNGCPAVVGGEIIPIDSAVLLLAGAQTSVLWMVPLLGGAAGIAIIYIKKRKN